MSDQAVERALGKLVLDCEFRSAFFSDPAVATRRAGIDLTEQERDTLAMIRPGALAAFKHYLDQKHLAPSHESRCERTACLNGEGVGA